MGLSTSYMQNVTRVTFHENEKQTCGQWLKQHQQHGSKNKLRSCSAVDRYHKCFFSTSRSKIQQFTKKLTKCKYISHNKLHFRTGSGNKRKDGKKQNSPKGFICLQLRAVNKYNVSWTYNSVTVLMKTFTFYYFKNTDLVPNKQHKVIVGCAVVNFQ